jgi:hypothetical protein
MNYLITSGWATQFKSLRSSPTRDSWDVGSAGILHRSESVTAVRSMYPRHLPVALGLGFYVAEVQVRPAARLPGIIMADVSIVGAFEYKTQATGAASAHSESPSNIRIPQLGTAVFTKTDILVCEPTFEVMALDNIKPDVVDVGTRVGVAYGGTALPLPPANPFGFGAADIVANRTVRWPYGWCFIGVEYERIGLLYLKRYYYAYRHLVTP